MSASGWKVISQILHTGDHRSILHTGDQSILPRGDAMRRPIIRMPKRKVLSSITGRCMAALLLLIGSMLCTERVFADEVFTDTARKVPAAENSIHDSDNKTSAEQFNNAGEKFFKIPLLYVTDRQISRKDFGNKRKVESGSIYDVYLGRFEYCLSNREGKSFNQATRNLGWQACEKWERMLCHRPEQPTQSLEKFAEDVMDVVNKSGQKEIYVFTHGYNNTFDSAAKCTALLAYHLEKPVILFSWPSTAKLLQYFVDSGNNEWSQEHFNRILETLCSLKEKHGLTINMVAHSMGNRLVVRAAPILEGKQLFHQVFLVDPDFDSQTFLHYVARYAQKKELHLGGKMRILFSHKDNALPVAQALFGGYTRLGQGADTIFESLFKPKQVLPELYDGTKSILGLSKYVGAESDEGAVHNLFRKNIEWIDFTVLDHGVIGHSIPYKLIAKLAHDSTPGPGLKLVPVEVGLSSKWLSRCLGGRKQPMDSFGFCKRVEFADKHDEASIADGESKEKSTR